MRNYGLFYKICLQFILKYIAKNVLFFGTFAKFSISSHVTAILSQTYSYLSLFSTFFRIL
jgi:hypothetical protein